MHRDKRVKLLCECVPVQDYQQCQTQPPGTVELPLLPTGKWMAKARRPRCVLRWWDGAYTA